jgi:hypothetical protein
VSGRGTTLNARALLVAVLVLVGCAGASCREQEREADELRDALGRGAPRDDFDPVALRPIAASDWATHGDLRGRAVGEPGLTVGRMER